MYEAMGLGWANSLLGLVALVLIVIPLILYKFGERIKTWQVPKM